MKYVPYNAFKNLPADKKGRITRSFTGREHKAFITLITGAQSGGKTYYASYLIKKYLERGYKVASNISVDWQGFVETGSWFDWFFYSLGVKRNLYRFPKENFIRLSDDLDTRLAEIERLSNCLLVIDEDYQTFNSKAKGRPQRVLDVFLQTNKRGVDFYLISPYASLVFKELRASCKTIISASSVGFGAYVFFFTQSLYRLQDVENLELEEEPYRRRLMFPRKSVYSFYDTNKVSTIHAKDYEVETGYRVSTFFNTLYDVLLIRAVARAVFLFLIFSFFVVGSYWYFPNISFNPVSLFSSVSDFEVDLTSVPSVVGLEQI